MKKAEKSGVKLILPVDFVVADAIDKKEPGSIVSADKVPPTKMIADIGPKTIELFSQELKKSKTVFWNGPMGVEEIPQFARGTEMLANLLPQLKAKTIIGGGSTGEVVEKLGLADKLTFVSTGGGASMEFLGGDVLPGVAALLDKK
jgi:phosphoglycerate kinase